MYARDRGSLRNQQGNISFLYFKDAGKTRNVTRLQTNAQKSDNFRDLFQRTYHNSFPRRYEEQLGAIRFSCIKRCDIVFSIRMYLLIIFKFRSSYTILIFKNFGTIWLGWEQYISYSEHHHISAWETYSWWVQIRKDMRDRVLVFKISTIIVFVTTLTPRRKRRQIPFF